MLKVKDVQEQLDREAEARRIQENIANRNRLQDQIREQRQREEDARLEFERERDMVDQAVQRLIEDDQN